MQQSLVMMSIKLRHQTSLLLLATLPALAVAHPGHGAKSSLLTGLVHPLRGLDHLFALLAVGLLAGRLGGRLLLPLAAAFLGLLGSGLAASVAALPLPLPVISSLAFITVGICVAHGGAGPAAGCMRSPSC
jgi:urease accessory protein